MPKSTAWLGRFRLLPRAPGGDVLDQLEREDRVVLVLLDELDAPDQLDRGVAAKLLVEHLAVRQSAREHLARALAAEDSFAHLGRDMSLEIADRRQELASLTELVRGMGPLDINLGQDTAATVGEMESALRREINRDLTEFLPLLRSRLSASERHDLLPSARAATHHALMHPDPRGRRWYEKTWGIARVRMVYDWLRRLPSIGGDGEPPRLERKMKDAYEKMSTLEATRR